MSGLSRTLHALRAIAAALQLRLLALTLAVAITIALAGCGDTTQRSALPERSVVLAFGNSITFGSGAGPGESYPAQLAARSGWQVLNAGIPGDTAATARERIDGALEVTRPALVIVELGGNDFLRNRPEAAVKEDLRAIIVAIKRSGAQVVLVAVPKFSLLGAVTGRLPESTIYAELASEEQLLLIAGTLAEVLSAAELKADPIHPNAKGYRQLAAGIAEQLHQAGLLDKR